jgi:hypothetical protein
MGAIEGVSLGKGILRMLIAVRLVLKILMTIPFFLAFENWDL